MTTTHDQPAPRRRRRKVDPEAAFQVYLDLGPQATYAEVAQRLDVSRRTIERTARKHQWPKRIAAMTAQAQREVDADRALSIAERRRRQLRMVDGAYAVLLPQLPDARALPPPSVLPELRRWIALEGDLLSPGEETGAEAPAPLIVLDLGGDLAAYDAPLDAEGGA